MGWKDKGRGAGRKWGWRVGQRSFTDKRPSSETAVSHCCEVCFSLESLLAGPQAWIRQEIKAALENGLY